MSKKKSKKPTLPPNEMFHAQHPVYSTDPIPQEFKFPLFDQYVIPLKHELAADPIFLKEKLVPFYEDIVNELTPVIAQIQTDIHKLEKKITSKDMDDSTKYKFNYINADLWRKFNTLLQEFNKLKNNLLVSRLSIMEKRVELLMKINNLALYLAEHPKYYYINYIHANQTWRSLEFNYLSSVYLQFRATKLAIRDIEQQLHFLPHPFSNSEENQTMFKNLIKDSIQTIDPLTGYVPASETYDYFYFFINSRHSPVRLPKNQEWKSSYFSKVFSLMIEKLSEFGEIIPDTPEFKILQAFSARYIFEVFCMVDRKGYKCEKAENYYLSNSTKSVSDIVSIDGLFTDQELKMTPTSLFKSISLISGLIDVCMTTLFESNPIDVLLHIQRANLALMVVLSNRTKKSPEILVDSPELKAFWELLLCASQAPGICGSFKFAEQWLDLPVVPDEFKKCIKIPLSLINLRSKGFFK